MMKLSAVIITYNEEANIGRCLKSLIPVVDEVVILDSFSKDRTLEIISQHGLNFIQREWTDYSDAKNYANSKATGEFILSIDADEELSPVLQQSILTWKNNPSADAYQINRLTNYCGKWIYHCGWYPEYKVRIFKRGTQWKGLVHEDLVFDNEPKVEKLKGDLYHYSYPTIDSHLKKVLQYSKLTAEKKFKAGKKYTLLWHGILKPWVVFFKKYILQLGVLDGYYGFVISAFTSFFHFLRYIHFRALRKANR
ncbi:glycosyltransferase family 2 protein [Ohtaekwangia koreensis]|uniref:(Heptosyl)LPS beta-1,4-glucosyltransferase n=1 Tax=Ohtaekwangia koreensis TaxID=688867 RepID=A0A1T5K915_9BACT|nr:glycosyltransferase family 2 protein [Ohtaekwangia koreensis]SKC60183.1 (heptosyl)LPS beta-1,4-glucosyltransferase [Ohtaekwangia koreensis]